MFWRIDTTELPTEHELEYEVSSTGDECHMNIRGVTDDKCRNMIKGAAMGNLEICDGMSHRNLTAEDIARLGA